MLDIYPLFTKEMRLCIIPIVIAILTMTDCVFSSDALMFDTSPPGLSLGWLDSRSKHWPDDNAKFSGMPSAADLAHMYRSRTLTLETLWTNIDRSGCRASYLSVHAIIVRSLMNPTKTTGRACRYSQMICYHLQVIVATLDVRAGWKRQQSGDGKPPPK